MTALRAMTPSPRSFHHRNKPQRLPVGREQLSKQEQPANRLNQRTERIRVEDGGSRIDELRVGGQTRRISVQTRTAVPGYEVTPAEQQPSGQAGRSSWRLLRF